ncbi:MAG: cysteine desulfuration protein SufE [Micavibrio sp.]|nr:cysteine desulfuration protein SufE [Micavibrio sp.]|tara:strand:+ start:158 stop:583 length:426 start_codon:yes stop_codon:yes gene_type:complete
MEENQFIALSEIEENFSFFSDWEERFQYLIDLGKSLPSLPDSYKTEEFKVKGCTSQVWLVPEKEGDKFYFRADSDAFIVRGLIYIILAAYNGKRSDEILSVDINQVFSELGLEQNLSPNRRNGFFSMVEKIKSYAGAAGKH